jgi:alkylhydroperoxidase family enzyme
VGAVPVRGLPPGPTNLPAIAFEAMPPHLQERIGAQVARLGYVGGFFGLAAHQPAALHAFVDFTEALKGALPFRLSEVVALTVAGTLGNDYEFDQHLRLCRARGLEEAWIAAVLADGAPDTGVLTTTEVAVGGLARACAHGTDGARELAVLVADQGQATAVAVLLLVGRYVAHATVSRAFGLRSPIDPAEGTP